MAETGAPQIASHLTRICGKVALFAAPAADQP
jgi:hypothetical protein